MLWLTSYSAHKPTPISALYDDDDKEKHKRKFHAQNYYFKKIVSNSTISREFNNTPASQIAKNTSLIKPFEHLVKN